MLVISRFLSVSSLGVSRVLTEDLSGGGSKDTTRGCVPLRIWLEQKRQVPRWFAYTTVGGTLRFLDVLASPLGLLECPYTWQVTALSARHPRAGRSGSWDAFYVIATEITHCHCLSGLWSHRSALLRERGDHANTSRQGSLGVILEDGFHRHVTLIVLVRLPSSRLVTVIFWSQHLLFTFKSLNKSNC